MIQRQTPLGHPVGGHRLSMPPESIFSARPLGAYRQTTLAGDLGAVDVGAKVPDLYDDLELRVAHIHPQVVVLIQQVGAQLPHQLRAGHGEALVRPAGLYLECTDAPQVIPQVRLCCLADGVKILFTDHCTAERCQAEHLADPLKGQVHISTSSSGSI